jgi:hypothetical protein
VELQPLFSIVPLDGLGEAFGHMLQTNLADAISCALKQSDLVLAERQDVEPTVAAEQREKRLDVKTVGDDHQFLKTERQAMIEESFSREKHCQAIALMPPEKAILQKPLDWFNRLLYLR